MLTRRQQLKLKQDQDEQKKKEKAGKAEKGGEEEKEKRKPKAKAKGKGKAKAKAKEVKEVKEVEVEDEKSGSSEDELPKHFVTPKKRLFEESDREDEQDGVGGGNPSNPNAGADKMVIDPETGELKSLSQIFEQFAPNAWKKKMRVDPDAAASAAAKAKGKAKAKAKGLPKAGAKGKAKAKPSPKAKAIKKGSPNTKGGKSTPKLDSPAIKKEQAKRRKRKEDNMVEEQPADMYDESITICLEEHLRRLDKEGEDMDNVKEFFKTKHFNKYQEKFTFSCYWDKHAIGLVFKGGKHFAYFAFKHSKATWAFNITMASVCAYLMVSFLEQSYHVHAKLYLNIVFLDVSWNANCFRSSMILPN